MKKSKAEIFSEIQHSFRNMVRGQNRTKIFNMYREKYGEIVDEILEEKSSQRPESSIAEKLVMVFFPERYFECPEGNRVKFDRSSARFTVCERSCPCAQEKRRKTMLDVYGAEHPMHSETIRKKAEETWERKYGTTKLSEINTEQKRNTCLERYGSETPLESEEVRKKIRESNKAKTGVEYPFQSRNVQENIQDNWSKVNVDGKRSYVRSKDQIAKSTGDLLEKKMGSSSTEILLNQELLAEQLKYKSRQQVANELGCSISLIDKRVREWEMNEFKSISYYETLIGNFLSDINVDFVSNTRNVISPLELDFYIPSQSLAIEFNGLHWHSELKGKKDRAYHLNKTELAREKGIHLIHIFQDEWDNKQEIVKSIIAALLGKTETVIYGRKTTVSEISFSVAKEFLDINHLQGSSIGTFLNLGLYYKDDLVSVMTFKRNRGKIELSRFVSKTNCNVIGGASKLFKYALKSIDGEVVTYSDMRYFSGVVYENLGFKRDGSTAPGYFYFKNANARFDRHHFMKHMLPSKLDVFDEDLSEWENMQMNGWDRIWDCGHHRFIFKRNE